MKGRNEEDLFLDDLAPAILSADAVDLEDVMSLVRQRYSQLFPQWEIYMVSVEKVRDRMEYIDRMIAVLESLKNK